MPRLPALLEPAFPLVKRTHRMVTRGVGAVSRPAAVHRPSARSLPHRATDSSWDTPALEPESVRIHPGGPAVTVDREPPQGRPRDHWLLRTWGTTTFPARYTLEIDDGLVVTRNAAHITPGGTLDYATSDYFDIKDWKEHPLFLLPRLPEPRHIDGTLVSLATRGTWANYYHVLMDLLPRWSVFRECLPDVQPDAVLLNRSTPYARELVSLAGLDALSTIEPVKYVSLHADRLLVPSMENIRNEAPPYVTQWLRDNLPARQVADRPRRIYVTRGRRRNSRRIVNEDEAFAHLKQRGFAMVDPGRLPVQDQIDQFAAADVVVAPHGAALANLNFAPAGVRVLEMFAPRYIDKGYWSIVSNVPDSKYRYLVGTSPRPVPEGAPMNRVYDDITVDLRELEETLDELLDSS